MIEFGKHHIQTARGHYSADYLVPGKGLRVRIKAISNLVALILPKYSPWDKCYNTGAYSQTRATATIDLRAAFDLVNCSILYFWL